MWYTTFLIIALVLGAWSALVLFLDKRKVLEKHNMSRIWGIALMWRTERGKRTIESIASWRSFWKVASTIGIAFFVIGMFSMFVIVALSALLSVTSPMVKPVGAQEIFVLPGINPYVPFIYGIIGLIVAVVVHELSHGIIARAMDFKVKSLGLLFMAIPIGAFMEPDEEQVEKGPRLSRMRMFASGPLMNFFFAFVFIMLFSWVFMGSIEAQDNPIILREIYEPSPFHLSLEGTPTAIYSINGTKVHTFDDLYSIEGFLPGNWTLVETRIDGGRFMVPMVAGVMIASVGEDTPASRAGLIEGSIILELNGIIVKNVKQFREDMDRTVSGQVINITVLEPLRTSDGKDYILNSTPPADLHAGSPLYDGIGRYPVLVERSFNITLAEKYKWISLSEYKGKGYLGVTTSFYGIIGEGSKEFVEGIHRPVANGDGLRGKLGNVMYIIFRLPLDTKLMPFHSPITDMFQVTGPLSVLPVPLFWFLVNTVFYIFWINILLGLFNALPMVPLDGGFVFRDGTVIIMKKLFRSTSEEKLVKVARKLSNFASLTVLFFILLSVFFPWIRVIFIG